jgi:hypothetical protein
VGLVSVAPAGLLVSHDHPRLTPWAAFWRRFACWPNPTAGLLFDFGQIPYYEGDLVRCRRQQVAFFIMADRSKLEWWFRGSIVLLAISILGFAYLFWESYLVTKN